MQEAEPVLGLPLPGFDFLASRSALPFEERVAMIYFNRSFQALGQQCEATLGRVVAYFDQLLVDWR